MTNVVIVGVQWGDEGKGKIVDWLSERADVVVRFQGGHNAGHTLVIDDISYKLSLLPSGIVRTGKLSIIGNGVVIDPWALLKEIEKLRKQGVNVTSETLKIAHDRMDSPSYALNISKKLIKIIKGRKYGTYHLSDHGYVSYYNFIKQLGKEIGFKGKILKAKHNSFPALAPNPLRAAMSPLKGGTGVFWKKALKMYVKDENIKC